LEPFTSGGSVLDTAGLFAIGTPALDGADAVTAAGCGAPALVRGTAAGAPIGAGGPEIGAVPALPGAGALSAGLWLRSP
jgi:hypothetical protein